MVYKFGGSSVRDAERMREVADIICSFPQYLPCVVLSAMGKVCTYKMELYLWPGRQADGLCPHVHAVGLHRLLPGGRAYQKASSHSAQLIMHTCCYSDG
jgi:hypothetical protein